VPPGGSGEEIGAALLEAMEARAKQIALPGGTVRVFVPSNHDLARRLAESRGYEPFRHSFRMRIDFDGELPEPEWPQGVSVLRRTGLRSPACVSAEPRGVPAPRWGG
jgi:hypothetical protein